MKKLIIHIGAHKTATTLLQKTLHSKHEELARQGVWYQLREGYDMGTILLMDSPLPEQRREDYKREFAELYDSIDQETIFWSCEGFIGDFAKSYHNLEVIAQDVKQITEGFDVHFILTIRRQDSFLESCFQQMLKQAELASWQAFKQQVDITAFDWLKIIERYQSIFPNASFHVLPYEMMRDDPQSVMRSVLEILDADLTIDAVKHVNPSLSKRGMAWARYLPYLPHPRLRSLARKGLEYLFPQPVGDTLEIVSDEERAEMLRSYQASNKILFERFMPESPLKDYYLSTDECA